MPRKRSSSSGQSSLDFGDSASSQSGVECRQSDLQSLAAAPKAFLTSPFFAAVPQPLGEKRFVSVGEYNYEIGGPVVTTKRNDKLYPALDVRHGELILASTTFWQRGNDGHQIEFSLPHLCAQLGVQKGGGQYQRMLELFQDMSLTAVRKKHRDHTEDDRRFPILKEVMMRGVNEVCGVVLDPRFAEMLSSEGESLSVRIDQLVSLRRSTSKALYLFMPSRAWHHTSERPFKRTLTNVLAEIGCKPVKHRSDRLARFERRYGGTNSVLEELNGAEIPGGKLRCDVAPTSDGEDFNLLVWLDRTRSQPSQGRQSGNRGALFEAWVESKRSERDFIARQPVRLDEYDREQLAAARIDLSNSLPFFERAKALVGADVFRGRIGDIKASVIGAGAPVANPTGALIGSLVSAVREGL